MRYWIGPLTVLALTLALIGWAKADPLDDAMKWVAENSRFEYRNDPPKIVPMSKEDWDINGWFMHWAVYDKGFIYIPDWQEVPESTWVHEAVHHYQYLNGEMTPETCPASKEPEAYALEDKWRAEQGMEPTAVDRFALISAQAACKMDDVHGR